MAKTKVKGGRGYAIVTKRGKVQVDTVCRTKDEVGFLYHDFHKKRGSKIKQVRVVVEE